MFCTFYICYVHLDLETLNTIRKKKNFLLTGQTKTNVYFVTCICTLTARNDIFQHVFVVPHRTFLPARAHVRPAPPHLKPVHFLKNPPDPPARVPPILAQPVPVPALKNPHPPVRSHMAPRDMRGKTSGPHISALETLHFLSKSCGDSSVLSKELFRQFSSYQRTVGRVLKIGTNLKLS